MQAPDKMTKEEVKVENLQNKMEQILAKDALTFSDNILTEEDCKTKSCIPVPNQKGSYVEQSVVEEKARAMNISLDFDNTSTDTPVDDNNDRKTNTFVDWIKSLFSNNTDRELNTPALGNPNVNLDVVEIGRESRDKANNSDTTLQNGDRCYLDGSPNLCSECPSDKYHDKDYDPWNGNELVCGE